jgi:heterotetrameric sarcosine oxidase gamma subunit
MSTDQNLVPELRSPWSPHAGRQGAGAGAAGLSVQAAPPALRLGIDPRRGQLEAMAGAILGVLGLELPAARRSHEGPGLVLFTVMPNRWHVLLEGAEASEKRDALRSALAGMATVVDLSHAFAALRLGGPAARTTLGQLVRIDLHDSAFPPGAVATTELHGMSVQLRRLMTGDYELAVARSFAHSLEHAVVHAGEPHGVEVSLLSA